jgi:hypothetical protein
MKWLIRSALVVAGLLGTGVVAQAASPPGSVSLTDLFGPRYQPNPQASPAPWRYHQPAATDTVGRVLYWNEAANQAVRNDHTPIYPGSDRIHAEQPGPTYTSRAMAIVQLAVFDAINAIAQRYPSYAGLPRAPSDSSPDAAVAQAAHDAIVALWPAQKARFDDLLAADLASIPAGRAKWNGIDLGRRAAAAVLALRQNDNSDNTNRTIGVDYFPSNAPGQWRPDPVSMSPVALGVTWGNVRPFVVPSVDKLRVPPPPSLASSTYTTAFNEVKRLGGNGTTTPTARTQEQTVIGMYWSYDSTPWIGPPPRMYNQMAAQIAQPRTKNPVEMARLLALVNAALADVSIAVWKEKYRYDFWRPVIAIREADEGSGPTGLGDGNPYTRGDPGWTPLGAQASNLFGPDFTPPFPSYPSGHGGFISALFQTLRRFYGTDNISFTFVSDEWNGITRDNKGWVRPLKPRSYSTLSQAENEGALSRIYLGVHWRFDLESINQGNAVANYVYDHGLVPPAASVVDCQCN